MGLVRADAANMPPETAAQDAPLGRRRAAHQLGQTPGAEAELGNRLEGEADPSVRAALFDALVAQGSIPAAEVLAGFLRAEDAAVRNGALEALIALPGPAEAVLEPLLADPDPGQRMFGALLAGELPLPGIALRLFAQLAEETEVNVCTTLLEVLAELGEPLPSALAATLAQRFGSCPIVHFLLNDLLSGGGASAPEPT
jgi:HEAT repeat protein